MRRPRRRERFRWASTEVEVSVPRTEGASYSPFFAPDPAWNQGELNADSSRIRAHVSMSAAHADDPRIERPLHPGLGPRTPDQIHSNPSVPITP
jgi:hypothetical protein